MPRPRTKEETAALVEMINGCETQAEAARKLGVEPVTMRNLCRRLRNVDGWPVKRFQGNTGKRRPKPND